MFFVESMNIATTSVEFSVDNVVYKQIDGVAMGNPLGPVSASQYIHWILRRKAVQRRQSPNYVIRYMDDTFAMFEKEIDCDMFLNQLNLLHLSLAFIHEKEVEGRFTFLNVLVEKRNAEFLTLVYRKSTFT